MVKTPAGQQNAGIGLCFRAATMARRAIGIALRKIPQPRMPAAIRGLAGRGGDVKLPGMSGEGSAYPQYKTTRPWNPGEACALQGVLEAEASGWLAGGQWPAVARMASLAAMVYHRLPMVTWCGFYVDWQGDGELVVGPYQGTPACLAIPRYSGICRRVFRTGVAEVIDDVESDPDHIACDSRTRSELVAPFRWGSLSGVFDLDSDLAAAFGREELEMVSRLLKTCEA